MIEQNSTNNATKNRETADQDQAIGHLDYHIVCTEYCAIAHTKISANTANEHAQYDRQYGNNGFLLF